ncbi:hypothetical protein [Sphaerospermopsis torques-reginae]|jgi:hypothetical protein|uniref:Uncharacterized protein n=1 Tax=Sphaerospermopsis torques-reginae ITEP-024 TaxID=984208 RepID=A0ABX8WWT2_9CYAN|nr:hypothetical protein [Sphaerospermopsis torques-reginae]QYX30896.1 hypothetical protein K2F26_18840 [Sphaerospermopsis torques-reginae ITEP-024]
MEHLNDSLSLIWGHLDFHINFVVSDYADYFLVGKVRDADVMGQMQNAWNNFVKTGQVWAMLIGMVIGYLFKSLTSYG